MVFAATAAGILALRSIVGNVADLTRLRKEALQTTRPGRSRTQPSTNPPRMCPSRPQRPPPHRRLNRARPHHPPSTASAQAASPGIWDAKPLAAFSGDELVYSATLGDWRTHNGADYAAPAGESVYPAKAGKVDSVTEDALWGYVVEITDKNGVTWRYCGLTDTEVKTGDSVTTATAIGKAGSVPAETNGECICTWSASRMVRTSTRRGCCNGRRQKPFPHCPKPKQACTHIGHTPVLMQILLVLLHIQHSRRVQHGQHHDADVGKTPHHILVMPSAVRIRHSALIASANKCSGRQSSCTCGKFASPG